MALEPNAETAAFEIEAEPRASAIVVVVRPAAPPKNSEEKGEESSERFEVFVVKRHGKSGFMPDAYVFPGGKLDQADVAIALGPRCRGPSDRACGELLAEPLPEGVSRAFFVAAIRETFEEAGLFFGAPAPPASARVDTDFAEALERADASLALDALVPISRWITPTFEKRRSDARVFMARAPAAQVASHDAHETTDGLWITPKALIARALAGEWKVPPPTLITLMWLARAGTIDEAFRQASAQPPPRVLPVVHREGDALILALPGDALHPEEAPAFDFITRLSLSHSGRDGGRYKSGLQPA